MNLYHYTCSHSADRIAHDLKVIPNPLTGLAWFTDLETPDRDALGLNSYMLECDRTEFQFAVDPDDFGLIFPWHEIRKTADPAMVRRLEAAPGVFLMHWWVSAVPVRVF